MIFAFLNNSKQLFDFIYIVLVYNSILIGWQNEILTAGGTDTASIQRMTPGGSIAGAFSIPTRHIHQVIEMVHKEDVRNAIDLLRNCIENLNKFDWRFK